MIPISEVAARVGVTVRTLRYYEEVGLLQSAERGPGGVRQYTEAVVERLRRILDLRNSRGFTLEVSRSG
jgi:DNA-binding transcriptional MerR regulator